ncbi:undecaprenyldiphospho-muramoylpentapeptide beta-N-acetylglucosaminyltransferase [Congregibacter variabilis]|uniref:UDP-N-acetylglucosamine--N-acetylmuramyl-(pentapeptide) pyrophosphoryl-undecaprenol N-acetylglucosamine transferase n=1 Tax=Congregibacter variabilis TaxID=3081200 RepID=A0ABZ0I7C2_9GAMM|nr:undecaprenyldiphospho-muramoylpentapeptide beta-N-acetylglucosaminyltransferase [Congregibacter sp. IMCC43200]
MSAPMAMMLAGGTGGHVYPALAVALDLRERGFRLAWIGTRRGLEARVVPAADIQLYQLPMRGLRGKGLLQQMLAVVLLGFSLLRSLWLMLRLRPALVVGMGGYASFPAALAAWLTRRPLLLQEQNAVPGSANRALARFASQIATGFPNVLEQYSTATYLGNPVRKDMLSVATDSPWIRHADEPLRVLVLGGSLGAKPLNEAMPAVAALLGPQCEWRHQCGPAHADTTRADYATVSNAQWSVEPYLEDMPEAYAWAQLVICRAGALTVAELAVTGRPSILIPLPYAIDDHQTANARFLSDAGAAVLLAQSDLDQQLEATLRGLIADCDLMQGMSSAALGCARPEATRMIADCGEALTR